MKTTSYLLFLLLVSLAACTSVPLSAQPVLTYTEGNPFTFTGSNTATALPTNNQWASFTAPETVDATGIRIDISGTFAGGTATYGLEAANVAGTGPSGTFLASGTLSSPALGFSELDFGSSVPLTAGTVYYVVVATSSGTINLRDNTGATPAAVQPYGYSDSSFQRGTTTTSSGTNTPSTTSALTYVVKTDGAYNLGNPYTGIADTAVTSTAPLAQHFVFQQPSTGNALSSATFALNITAAPTASVTFSVLDSSNHVLGQTTLASGAFTLGLSNYTVNFSDIALTSGLAYNLVVSTNSAGVTWERDNTDAVAADEAATFQGISGYSATYNAALTTENSVLTSDYVFTYTTIASAVPEPSAFSMAILGLGLFAGVGIYRRKRTAA